MGDPVTFTRKTPAAKPAVSDTEILAWLNDLVSIPSVADIVARFGCDAARATKLLGLATFPEIPRKITKIAPVVKYCESCGTRPATKGEYCLPCHKTMFPEQYPAPKPKAEKEPPKPTFSPAFKAAWPDFKQSVESIFKKWPAKLVEWEIIKSEVESKS